ncbi:MAG: DUF11 domain-containing protein [Oscillospiraceae bacterium]|nr:DUF11 domain-containing protein [Oscillospiraceae bacterium]
MDAQTTRADAVCPHTASVRGQYRMDPYGTAGTISQKSNPAVVHVLRVEVTKTVVPTSAHWGEPVTYTIVICNKSDLPLQRVKVFDSHAAQWFDISNVTVNGNHLSEEPLADGILVGTLPAGERAVLTFQALPRETAPDAPVSAAEVTYEYELQGMSHSGRVLSNPAELVRIQPGISIWKAADRAAAWEEGPPVLYQIKVENTGNVPLHQVEVTNSLPPQLEYVPRSLHIEGRTPAEAVSLEQGIALGDLAVDETVEIRFYARVKP